MTRNTKYLMGGIALAALAAGGIAASAHRGEGGWGHHHGGGKMGMMGAICGGNAAEMADHMLVRLEYKVKPTDAQKPAFEELKAAAKAAAAKAKAGCPAEPVRAADGAKPAPKAPTEKLAMMEAKLAAELDAVRAVRPAADKFYATLSDDQKKALTEREGGKGGWQHRDEQGGDDRGGDGGRGHHGRGGERGDAPGAAPPLPDKK